MEWLQQFGITSLAVISVWIIKSIFEPYFKKRSENQAVLADLDKINRQIESIKNDFAAPNSYLSEKGKNLATKEDVKEITHEVESIKNNFTQVVELLRYELNKQITVHKLAVEKEFEALSEIGIALVKMQDAMYSLRPIMESRDPNESDEERDNRVYTDWAIKTDEFTDSVKKYRLFLPPPLYVQFMKIRRISGEEGIYFRYTVQSNRCDSEIYKKSLEKQKELGIAIDEAINFIQTRFGIK